MTSQHIAVKRYEVCGMPSEEVSRSLPKLHRRLHLGAIPGGKYLKVYLRWDGVRWLQQLARVVQDTLTKFQNRFLECVRSAEFDCSRRQL